MELAQNHAPIVSCLDWSFWLSPGVTSLPSLRCLSFCWGCRTWYSGKHNHQSKSDAEQSCSWRIQRRWFRRNPGGDTCEVVCRDEHGSAVASRWLRDCTNKTRNKSVAKGVKHNAVKMIGLGRSALELSRVLKPTNKKNHNKTKPKNPWQ